MYVSFDNGKKWVPSQLNLPATPVTDLKVYKKDLVLSTQGRAFWILDNLTPLHQMSDAIADNPNLLKPRDAYRFRYTAGFGGVESTRSNPADPQYPPAGAAIDYWLPNGGVVTLEVVDASNAVIRRFSSDGAGEREQMPDQ